MSVRKIRCVEGVLYLFVSIENERGKIHGVLYLFVSIEL